ARRLGERRDLGDQRARGRAESAAHHGASPNFSEGSALSAANAILVSPTLRRVSITCSTVPWLERAEAEIKARRDGSSPSAPLALASSASRSAMGSPLALTWPRSSISTVSTVCVAPAVAALGRSRGTLWPAISLA